MIIILLENGLVQGEKTSSLGSDGCLFYGVQWGVQTLKDTLHPFVLTPVRIVQILFKINKKNE